MTDFITWLRSQSDREDPIGDLAAAMRGDKCAPRKGAARQLRAHLVRHSACHAAVAALRQAAREWRSVQEFEAER